MKKHTPKFNRRPKRAMRVKSHAKMWLKEYLSYLFDDTDDLYCNNKVTGV